MQEYGDLLLLSLRSLLECSVLVRYLSRDCCTIGQTSGQITGICGLGVALEVRGRGETDRHLQCGRGKMRHCLEQFASAHTGIRRLTPEGSLANV